MSDLEEQVQREEEPLWAAAIFATLSAVSVGDALKMAMRILRGRGNPSRVLQMIRSMNYFQEKK